MQIAGDTALHALHAMHARFQAASTARGSRLVRAAAATAVRARPPAPSKRSRIDHYDSVGPSVCKPSERTESEALRELCSGQQRT